MCACYDGGWSLNLHGVSFVQEIPVVALNYLAESGVKAEHV